MAKREWDTKFASSKRKVEKDPAKETAEGDQKLTDGQVPPPSAPAGRQKSNQGRAEKTKRSWAKSLWPSWGSKHDKEAVKPEQQADKAVESVVTGAEDANAPPSDETESVRGKAAKTVRKIRSLSRQRAVADDGQAEKGNERDENASVLDVLSPRKPDTPTKQDDKAQEGKVSKEEERKGVKQQEILPADKKEDKQQEEKKEEAEARKERKEDEDEVQSWFQASDAPNDSEKAESESASEQPIVVKKPEIERLRPDSSVLGIRVVTETKSTSNNFDFPFSSPKEAVPEKVFPEKVIASNTTQEKVTPKEAIPAKAEDASLNFNFDLLKSPTLPLSPLSNESLSKHDSKSPIDKPSFEKSPAKSSFDHPVTKFSEDKAEAEGLRAPSPPRTPLIVEPPEEEKSATKTRKARPKSAFVTSLKRALTKRSAPSNPSLPLPSPSGPGPEPRSKSSASNTSDSNWKAFEANGHAGSLTPSDKAYESGTSIKKSLSTRDPKRAPLAKSTTWKAEEAGSGGLRARPSVSKRPLPMLKKDYVPPITATTTLHGLASMAEDDELPKPNLGARKERDVDAISDYLTW